MPEIRVGNVRIKQKYKPTYRAIDYVFPPKWEINDSFEYKPVIKNNCISLECLLKIKKLQNLIR